MRTWRCVCGQTIFFENTACVTCGRELGVCPECEELTALLPNGVGRYLCGNEDCRQEIVKCRNYESQWVCNHGVLERDGGSLCRNCRFTETIPDLSVPGNLEKWSRLEAAKRRLFYDLDLLSLPYGTAAEGFCLPLAFDFKADALPPDGDWRSSQDGEQVFTGHANGRITINLREADDAERERTRVEMGESQRTLIGHFRHEIGHYYWDLLIKDRTEEEFKVFFGDHHCPNYAEALQQHYQNGPPFDWRSRFVTAYATMHPWEDFAETWATYLDMISTLDTASHNGLIEAGQTLLDFDAMLLTYGRLGIALNEFNRNLGLLDAAPKIFVAPVVEKLRYVHRLIAASGRSPFEQRYASSGRSG